MSCVLSVVIAFFLMFSISCASEKSNLKESKQGNDNHETENLKIESEEGLTVQGYSEDSEMNKKMKTIDLEIIDCYKEFYEEGNTQETRLFFSAVIDETGSLDTIKFKENSSKIANKIAKCIRKDMRSLTFRPGKERDVKYQLYFKPTKTKEHEIKARDERSTMIANLTKMEKFRACYSNQKRIIRGNEGKFSLRFTVTKNGKVANIKLTYNTFKNSGVVRCVMEKLEETLFPEGKNSDQVDVTFDFTNSSEPLPNKKRKSMDIEFN